MAAKLQSRFCRNFGNRPGPPRLLGAGRIETPRHDRRYRARDGAAFAAVIGNPGRHQKAAYVGEAQPKRAVVIRELRDFLGGKLRHENRYFENDRPQTYRVLEGGDIEASVLPPELHEI